MLRQRPNAAPAAVEGSLLQLSVAFAAVYLIWGSTYLAIRFAIETLPPFTMAGVRFVVAGALLYAWTRRVRGVQAPSGTEWRAGAVVGGLLLLGGNGAVVWAEQWVPSGLAALLIATVPLWMVLLEWLAGGARPTGLVVLGLVQGLIGVGLLVGGRELGVSSPATFIGGLAVLAGSFLWAAGSIYSRRAPLPAAPRMGTAVQMLTGGAMLLVAGLLLGEWATVDVHAISVKSALSLLYLIVFGSLVAFSAYIWLLRATTPARVATYAYVNPVVALVLGWALADEPLSPRTLLAAAVILTAVMIINLRSGGSRRRPPNAPEPAPPRRTGRPAVPRTASGDPRPSGTGEVEAPDPVPESTNPLRAAHPPVRSDPTAGPAS